MSGYVKLWRKLQDNELWQERRTFSRAEAFIDLIMSANWQDTVLFDGTEVKRGELAISIRELAHKWGWHKSRIERFLTNANGTLIGTRAGHRCTIIRVLNYEYYQDLSPDGGTRPRQQCSKNGDTNRDTKKEEGRSKNKPSPNGEGARAREAEPEKKNLAPRISMTDAEAKALVAEFGPESVKYHIKVCSDSLVANGRAKKNAAAFIRNWIRRDIAERRGFYSAAKTIEPTLVGHPSRKLFKEQQR